MSVVRTSWEPHIHQNLSKNFLSKMIKTAKNSKFYLISILNHKKIQSIINFDPFSTQIRLILIKTKISLIASTNLKANKLFCSISMIKNSRKPFSSFSFLSTFICFYHHRIHNCDKTQLAEWEDKQSRHVENDKNYDECDIVKLSSLYSE